MILVTGASGMVGSHLLDVFSEAELYRTDLHASEQSHALDCRDRDQVMAIIGRVRPDIVLHMAAETDVDRCERDIDHAFRSNTLATLNIALACQRHNVTLVYISTAGVFDGKKPEPYTEFDLPSPVNVYATSKLEGEKFVQSFVSKHYIVRAGWMFGGKGKDKKFVGKIASLCLDANGADIKAVDDKFGCPTYAVDLLAAVKTLIQSGFYGVYHLVNSGSCSRYDVAVEISRFLGRTGRVVPVCSANFPLSAPRPRSEASRPYKFELLGLGRMRTWREALADYLTAWQAAAVPAVSQAVAVPPRSPANGADRWGTDTAGTGGLDKPVYWNGVERRGELETVKVTPIAPAAAAVV